MLLFIVALPILLLFSFKEKYKLSLPARFFLSKNRPFKSSGIWFHACSLGEVNSLKPIFKELKDFDINLSVITGTGYKSAKSVKGLHIRFLPYEMFLPFWIRKQKVLVVTEAELWPMLFFISRLRDIKTILINARISDNSYKSYKRFSFFYNGIFNNIDVVFAQSEIDKKRLKELGAKNVHVNGNIKTIAKPIVTKRYVKPNKKIISIASSHDEEEELILKNLQLKQNEILVVAPRHPERFKSVEKILTRYTKEKNLTFSQMSVDDTFSTDVVLCDKMGELVNIYAISDVVILCGSFIDGIGGHNPLEPAFFNTKIISGVYTFNQKALFPLVEGIKVCMVEQLKDINLENLENSKILQKGEITTLLKEIKGEIK